MNKVKKFPLFKYIRFFFLPTFLSQLLVLSSNSLVTTPVQPEETAITYSDNIVPPLITPLTRVGSSPASPGKPTVVALVSAAPTTHRSLAAAAAMATT
jgi:hypothetical protein